MSDIARIEDNVRTMIGKGAPASDIDAYLKIEGHTPDSFSKAVQAPQTTGGKIAAAADGVADKVNTGVNWLGTQFTKGITGALGAPDTLGELGKRGAAYVGEKLGAPETGKNIGTAFKNQMTFGGAAPTTEGMNRFVFGSLGVPEVNAGDNPALTHNVPFPALFGEGKVNYGKMLDVGAQAIPGMLAGPGGAAAKIVPAMAGGMASEAAGQATAGTPWEIPARLAGGLAGGLAGAKAVTPLKANLTPEQARLVQIAKDKEIPMTVGQETGRGRGIESALARFPTSAGQFAKAGETQRGALINDALDEMGQVGTKLDPQTMGRVAAKASSDFDAARNATQRVELQPDFFNKAGAAVGKYTENEAASNIIPGVAKKLDDFFDPKLMKDGPFPELDGTQYQQFRKSLNDSVDALYGAGNSGAAKAMQGIRTALDDAAEASLPADKMAAWKEARKNWSTYKILSKATAGGTVESRAAGDLSPSALTSVLRQRQGVDQFAKTEGGLNDTARLSGYLADTRPNSGTPQTLAMQSLLTGGPLGFAVGGVPGALSVGAGLAAPNIMARAMTGSRGAGWLRDYLANQQLARPGQTIATVPFSLAPNMLTDQRGRRQ